MRSLRFVCLVITALCIFSNSFGQRAILVMLRSEQGRIGYFTKRGMSKEASRAQKDAKNVIAVTINDFEDHYNLTPVYYFIDSNLSKIKSGELKGVLLNTELKPVVISNPEDLNYLIVSYGVPNVEISNEGNSSGKANVYRSVLYPGDGLVVRDKNYRLLKKPDIHYIREPEIRAVFSRPDPTYNYSSKYFDIGYQPYAKILQRELIQYPEAFTALQD